MIQILRKKILAYFSIFTILILVSITYLFFYISNRTLREINDISFQKDSQIIFANVYKTITDGKSDFQSVKLPGYEVYIETNNKIIAIKDPMPRNYINLFHLTRQAEAKAKLQTSTTYHYKQYRIQCPRNEECLVASSTDLYDEGKITIVYSLKPFSTQYKTLRRRFAIACAFVLLLFFILEYLFVTKVLDPIKISNEKQREFIAAASHELKTPLTVIKSSLYALKDAKGEEFQKYYDITNDECSRMADLVNDLLTLSRIDGQRWAMNILSSPIEPVLFQCYNQFEHLAIIKGISLRIDLPDNNLPPVLIDRNRFLQLLAILVNNALAFTKKGYVTLRAYEKKRNLYVVVEDTGIGISNIQKEKIFDRFYTSNHNDPSHFGLGLSIAKEIIDLHGATILVEDNEPSGCRFIIKLTL